MYCVHAVNILMHKIDIKMKRKSVVFNLPVQGYDDETTVRNLFRLFLKSWFPALCFYIITLSAEVVINPQGRCIEF